MANSILLRYTDKTGYTYSYELLNGVDGYYLGTDWGFGQPEPDTAVISSQMLDGDRISGRRSGNRSITIPLWAVGKNVLQVAQRINALTSVWNQQTFQLRWTPDGGLPIVFNCYRGSFVREYQTNRDGQLTSGLTLTCSAQPFGRSEEYINVFRQALPPKEITPTLTDGASANVAGGWTSQNISQQYWTESPDTSNVKVLSAVAANYFTSTQRSISIAISGEQNVQAYQKLGMLSKVRVDGNGYGIAHTPYARLQVAQDYLDSGDFEAGSPHYADVVSSLGPGWTVTREDSQSNAQSLRYAVGDVPLPVNLWPNPSFEADPPNLQEITNTALPTTLGYLNATGSAIRNGRTDSAYALQLAQSGTPGNTTYGFYNLTPMPVIPGKTYTLSYAANVQDDLEWRVSAQWMINGVSQPTYMTRRAGSPGGARYVWDAVAPSGATSLVITIYKNIVAAGEVDWFDAIRVTTDGSTDYLDGSSPNWTWDGIPGQSSSKRKASGYLSAGASSEPFNIDAAASTRVTFYIKSTTPQRNSTTYRNLLTNPAVRVNTTDWSATASGLSVTRDATDPDFPEGCLLVARTAAGAAEVQHALTAVSASTQYTFSVDGKGMVGRSFMIAIDWYDSGGVKISRSNKYTHGQDGTRFRSSVTATSPSNAVNARCILFINNQTSGATQRWGYFRLTTGTETAYYDGASTGWLWTAGAEGASQRNGDSQNGSFMTYADWTDGSGNSGSTLIDNRGWSAAAQPWTQVSISSVTFGGGSGASGIVTARVRVQAVGCGDSPAYYLDNMHVQGVTSSYSLPIDTTGDFEDTNIGIMRYTTFKLDGVSKDGINQLEFGYTVSATTVPASSNIINTIDFIHAVPPSTQIVTPQGMVVEVPNLLGTARAPVQLQISKDNENIKDFLVHVPPPDQPAGARIMGAISSPLAQNLAIVDSKLSGTYTVVAFVSTPNVGSGGVPAVQGQDVVYRCDFRTFTQGQYYDLVTLTRTITMPNLPVAQVPRMIPIGEITLPLRNFRGGDKFYNTYDIATLMYLFVDNASSLTPAGAPFFFVGYALLDTRGSTVMNPTRSYPFITRKVQIKEPDPATEVGDVMSVTNSVATDDSNAFSILQNTRISGGSPVLYPGANRLLVASSSGQIPRFEQLNYQPRWLADRSQ